MITGMRRCVACDDLWPWPIYYCIIEHSATSLKLHELFPHYHLYPVYKEGGGAFTVSDTFIFATNNHYHSRVCRVLSLLQNSNISIFWHGIHYYYIVWVIMRRRGVSSERRGSSCSSFHWIGIFLNRIFNVNSDMMGYSRCGHNQSRRFLNIRLLTD